MSKRKPVKASKQARSKVAPKALRARQAVVRSAKPSASRSRPKQQSNSTVDAAVHEAPAAALPIVESPAIASQNESQLVAKTVKSAKAIDVFPAAANVWAVPTKLPQIAQANMKLAFEFAQRLTQIKSPFELPSVFSEYTLKQFAMLQEVVLSGRREKQGV